MSFRESKAAINQMTKSIFSLIYDFSDEVNSTNRANKTSVFHKLSMKFVQGKRKLLPPR